VSRKGLDVVSLVAGLFFLGVAGIWGFSGHRFSFSGNWALPTLLVGVGVIGLLATLAGAARRRNKDA
jgi:hypothetical protein